MQILQHGRPLGSWSACCECPTCFALLRLQPSDIISDPGRGEFWRCPVCLEPSPITPDGGLIPVPPDVIDQARQLALQPLALQPSRMR